MSDRLRDEELAEISEYNNSYIESFGTGSVVDMQVHALLAEIAALKAENAKLTESLKQWRELVPTTEWDKMKAENQRLREALEILTKALKEKGQ